MTLPAERAPTSVPATQARGRPRSVPAATAVLDAAYGLSARHGLRGATIQAIASESGVSRMTIYKWWESRLHLLIDAYMRQATLALPLSESAPPLPAIHAHAQRYLVALRGDLGQVQMAVLAECLAQHGNSDLFVERYLSQRRRLGIKIIRRGQADGSVLSSRPASALYDQIFGTMFYRSQFGLAPLDGPFVRSLVEATLMGTSPNPGGSMA